MKFGCVILVYYVRVFLVETRSILVRNFPSLNKEIPSKRRI